MNFIDWSIVSIFFVSLVIICWYIESLVKSPADFVAANRCAGRYLLTSSTGMAGLGAVVVISFFEMFYETGFSGQWWLIAGIPISLIVSLSGWVRYRIRRTRCLTLIQFLEVRYSRNFRIFYGIVAFSASIACLGIIPAVAGRFFMYFCSFHTSFMIGTIEFQTFHIIMLILLFVALFFTFVGGQITVLVTDYFQSMFASIVCLLILVFVLSKFGWATIIEGLEFAPENASMTNPFRISKAQNFTLWFYLVMAFNWIFVYPTAMNNQSASTSAENAHEGRMAGVLGNAKDSMIYMVIIILPILAFTLMHHPKYSEVATQVHQTLSTIQNQGVHKQLITPLVLLKILPTGMIGLFCAFMISAFISTIDTLLHIHGSIFVQDVILPFRKNHFDAKLHLKILRISVVFIAIGIFIYSALYKQTLHIMMYNAIINSIYAAGASAAVIGGLYWNKGTTCGAWAASITGLITGIIGFLFCKLCTNFPMTAQTTSFFVIILAWISYIATSLIENKVIGRTQGYDMDKLLRRGRFSIEENKAKGHDSTNSIYRIIGITSEFTFFDKITYISVMLYQCLYFLIFVVITFVYFVFGLGIEFWHKFWYVWVVAVGIQGIIMTTWFIIGGQKDFKKLCNKLRNTKRDYNDDGIVNKDKVRPHDLTYSLKSKY